MSAKDGKILARLPLTGSSGGLKIRILRSGEAGATGHIWSQGITSDKTFRQLTKEFDQMIVLQVWEREGRKISRMAKKLSISPKKVRRIFGEMEL